MGARLRAKTATGELPAAEDGDSVPHGGSGELEGQLDECQQLERRVRSESDVAHGSAGNAHNH